MTHRHQDLETVRKACIAANPEIGKRLPPPDLPLPVKYDGVSYYWGKNGEIVADFDEGVNTGDGFRIRGWGRIQDAERQDACAIYIQDAINDYEKITLADVLLAIGEAGKMRWIGPSIRESYGCWLRFEEDGEAITCAEDNSWNLRATLDGQSDECLEFLASLLNHAD